MQKITEVTRQDIIDIIKEGIWVSLDEPKYDVESGQYIDGYSVNMPFYGRLSEIEFLERIYNLEKMPSSDSRFSNAYRDIWQHTINNEDWDDYWCLSDRRFHLSNGNDDQYILRFICEMLHPAVRFEDNRWKKYLETFNELLKHDGYELYSVRNISGRDVFGYKELNSVDVRRAENTENIKLTYIGSGSYADVYKYYDSFYKKTFAVKRAKESIGAKALERFKREFEEMSKLNSQYVVEVYSYNDEKNEYIMEFMDETLEHYITRNYAELNKTQKAIICSKILKAFKELHKNEVFHRDISPQNILIKKYMEGIAFKVADFGLVKTPESNLTTTNTSVRGSLNDPSLATTGFKNYSIVHEIYALTRLMVYILTGSLDHSSIIDVSIQQLLDNGTNPVTDKRYKSIDELKEAVLDCIKTME